MKKLMTVKELSELLNVKEKTIYQWAELEQIPSLKLNGSLRFDFDDIMSWIKSCKKAADSGYNSVTQVGRPKSGGDK